MRRMHITIIPWNLWNITALLYQGVFKGGPQLGFLYSVSLAKPIWYLSSLNSWYVEYPTLFLLMAPAQHWVLWVLAKTLLLLMKPIHHWVLRVRNTSFTDGTFITLGFTSTFHKTSFTDGPYTPLDFMSTCQKTSSTDGTYIPLGLTSTC